MTLWLARHPRPLIQSGVCYGALDMDADPQATDVAAQALAGELPGEILVQISPLKRCRQLAQALANLRADLRFEVDPLLREMDFGIWEGVAWSDIPHPAVEAWTTDFATHRFGGKESANELLARVAGAWDALQPACHAAWIAHAGVAQAATLLHQGIRHVQHAKDWPVSPLSYGEWIQFQFAPTE